MDKLLSVLQTLDKIEAGIAHHEAVNVSISQWSVGMHIGHCLLATIGISRTLLKSEPYQQKVKRNLGRRYVFRTGTIPRGRGKAPQTSTVAQDTGADELNRLLSLAREMTEKAAETNSDSYWEHFAFGVMKRDDALRFVEIHNNHHLKIIDDILADD